MATVRVLFVDDSADDVYLATHQLRRAGLDDVHAVASAWDLQRELEGWRPQIVLSDVRMPGFDGFQALEIVRKCAPTVPFILLSGGAQRCAARALGAGAYAVVEKECPDNLPRVFADAFVAHVAYTGNGDTKRASQAAHASVRYMSVRHRSSALDELSGGKVH